MSGPQILPDISKLKSDMKEIRDNQLTGKYYTPTIRRVQNTATSINVNPLPSTWTGSGNTYSNGEYVIESTISHNSTTNTLDKAFNGNTDDAFISATWYGVAHDITITLPEPLIVTKIKMDIQNHVGLDGILFEGSNDKDIWSGNLATLSNLGLGLTSYEVKNLKNTGPNDKAYKYYRLSFINESSSSSQIAQITLREFQIESYSITTYRNELSLLEVPNTLNTDQRLMVRTTSNLSTVGVSYNRLNGKDIDLLLQPNRYYELVYNGSMYLAKEVI